MAYGFGMMPGDVDEFGRVSPFAPQRQAPVVSPFSFMGGAPALGDQATAGLPPGTSGILPFGALRLPQDEPQAPAGSPLSFGPGSAAAGMPMPSQAAPGPASPGPGIRPFGSLPIPAGGANPTPPGKVTSDPSPPLPPPRPTEFGGTGSWDAPAEAGSQAAVAQGGAGGENPGLVDRFLSGIKGGLRDNSNLLLGAGIGLMSQRGFGPGLAAGLKYGTELDNSDSIQGLAKAKTLAELQKYGQQQGNQLQTAKMIAQRLGIPVPEAMPLAANQSVTTDFFKRILGPEVQYRQETDAQGNTWQVDPRTNERKLQIQGKDGSFTLGPNQTRYGEDGNVVARGGPGAPNVQSFTLPDGSKVDRQLNPATGQWEEPGFGANPPQATAVTNPFGPGKFNEGQGKAAGFTDRMMGSEQVLRGLEDINSGILGGAAGATSQYTPNGWKTSDRQRFTGDALNALRGAGLDPAGLSPEFAQHVEQAFRAKGVSPAAIREAQAAEFGIPLSRGQATQDPAALALERQSAAGSRGGRALDVAADFGQRQTGAIDAARTGLLGRIAGNAPTIDNPAVAGEMIADRARGLAGDAAFRAAAAQRTADTALERVRGPMPPDPLDAASSVMQGVRDAAGRGKAAYRSAYDEVAAIPGEFMPGALDRMGARVQRGLGPEFPIDPVLTPSATRALQNLDNIPGLFNAEPGTGPNLRQFDQVRKRLVSHRKAAGLNATDRRAMDKILEEFDGHGQAALEAGLFGPRQAAGAADDFPGFSPATGASDVPFPDLPQAAAGGRERAPESLIQYLARQGGIRMNGDTRAADLHRVMTGTGPLARMNGRPLDELRVPLIEEGFLRPDADGGYARNITNEVMDLIRRERAGEPVYRASDAQRAANLDRGGRAADADTAYAERVGEFTQRAQMELEASGLRARDLDPAALRDAAESMMLGHADDAATAYERAVMNGPARGAAPRPAAPEAAPFPGEGAAAPAASAALPGGSSAPFEAMQKARGLFADYQRTFRPNGPGDDVGRAVQRMVERDAQPGEVATMLFGGSRAGNTGLSVRMAERMRGVLGEDSPGWQAVQQGLISKAIEGRGGDVGSRLDHLPSEAPDRRRPRRGDRSIPRRSVEAGVARDRR